MSKTNRPCITYVAIEDPKSGLFKTQVLDLLSQLRKTSPFKIRLCIFIYPWHLFFRRQCLTRLRETCAERQICLHVYPVLLPVKYSLMSVIWFRLTTVWLAVIAQLLPKSDVVHCRGYFATFLGLKSRLSGKVIFDTRSSWVDENIAAGRLAAKSNLHAKWLKFEQRCFRSAAYTIGVSNAMSVVASRGPAQVYETIPIVANSSLVGFSKSFRSYMRQQLGWEHRHVAAYSGSLGLDRINKSVLTKLLALLVQAKADLRFLFLTSEDPDVIGQILRLAGIEEGAARCLAVSSEELGNYLSIADFGIHALPLQPDSETRLGTKVVEYWVNGLPVLVTSSVGAAARIINEHGVGQVLPIGALEGSSHGYELDISGLNRDNSIRSFKAFDIKQFDIESVAEKYARVYELLLRQALH